MIMQSEDRRNDIRSGRIIPLHPGEAELDDVTSFPDPGALVHVLVKPLLADGEAELVDEGGQPRVDRPERVEDLLQVLNGHEVVAVGR